MKMTRKIMTVLALALACAATQAGGFVRGTRSGGGSFDLAAEIATIRASSDYGSTFTDTARHSLEPSGLALPTAPSGLTPVSCTTLACVESESTGQDKEITLTGGPFTTASGYSVLTIGASGNCSNLRIILTGVTISYTDVASLTLNVNPRCSRVEIVGGTINGGGFVEGRDIKLYNVTAVGCGTGTYGGYGCNYWQWYGHRIAVEHSSFTSFMGGVWYTGQARDAIITGSISGTTLTVTSTTHGALAVGQKLVAVYGTTIAQGTSVVADLGGGQWQISEAGSGSGGIWAETPTSNFIAANSIATVPAAGGADGHETASRFNGCQFCVILKSRLYTQVKANLRSHFDCVARNEGGPVLWKGNQLEEGSGTLASEPGASCIHPATSAIYMDGNTQYNSTQAGIPSVPYYSQLYPAYLTGSGSTATITLSSDDYLQHGFSAGEVVNVVGSTIGGYNATGVSVTVTGDRTATYSNSTTGSATATINRTAVVNTLFWAKNNVLYGTGVTNDAGWVPGGYGAPHASWSTVTDTSTSYSNGNKTMTYTSTPAWSFR